MNEQTPVQRDPRIRFYAAATLTALIALIGAGMMTLTSSPEMKGAAFLWIPAALQMVAGVWLGPWYGLVAGGVGAYMAGIIAYGGFALPDIIMNLVAGGVANGMLPALLFPALSVKKDLGGTSGSIGQAVFAVLLLLVVCLVAPFVLRPLGIGSWAYFIPLAALLVAPLALRGVRVERTQFVRGFLVVVVVSAVSACIGVIGVRVSGQGWVAAVIGTGIGWFLGDTLSCVLGLYVLTSFTADARRVGITS